MLWLWSLFPMKSSIEISLPKILHDDQLSNGVNHENFEIQEILKWKFKSEGRRPSTFKPRPSNFNCSLYLERVSSEELSMFQMKIFFLKYFSEISLFYDLLTHTMTYFFKSRWVTSFHCLSSIMKWFIWVIIWSTIVAFHCLGPWWSQVGRIFPGRLSRFNLR